MIDFSSPATQHEALAAFFKAYQAFTARPDDMLARRGLSRVHHRILFFIARSPELSVSELLARLKVSKQALNVPLRQLVQMRLVDSRTDADDKRKRLLVLTADGLKLEAALRKEQIRLLRQCFEQLDDSAVAGWLEVNLALARHW
ncbi:MarR family winged helix-turn-helix transcriptional regulator [Isoalcanivorax beigongshangi]|uniref:MarR family winged helix-turn-helix transcriptional regulator n=1 Tax=Isoalcanivorax beigongshangi TaxID=3238810 RepID=A0ABV4AGV3_9GAMM